MAAVAAVLATAAPASAGWRAGGSATSADLGLAGVGSRLDPRAAGGTTTPGSATYSAGPGYVDLVNTSSVSARVTLRVTAGGLVNLSATARGCDVPWSAAGTCAAGETTVTAGPVVLGSTSTATTEVVLPAGERRYVRVTTSLALAAGASVVLRSSAVPAGTPRDRTAG